MADIHHESRSPDDRGNAPRKFPTDQNSIQMDAHRTHHRVFANSRWQRQAACGSHGLLRTGNRHRLGQEPASGFCPPVSSARLCHSLHRNHRYDPKPNLRHSLPIHRESHCPAALHARLCCGQRLASPGPATRGGFRAHRYSRPFLWRQVGDVRLLPVRALRLRRLVRSRHRLRYSPKH